MHLGERDSLVRPDLVVDVEGELFVHRAFAGGNDDHAATLRGHIRGRPGFDVVGSPAELQAEVPVGLVKQPGTNVSAKNENALALAA